MEIHITKDGQQYGPYTLEEVNAQLAGGDLSPNDLAWHEGAPGWIMLSAVDGVVAPAPRTSRSMPPPQPTSVSPVGAPSGGVATVIPYKNLPALIGYYCGVFGIVLPCALTQVFCYRVAAVASVECYPKLEAMNGNCQQVGAEGNLGSGARSV